MSNTMKVTHTIQINDARRMSGTVSETRVTTGKRYTACIVVTQTEASAKIAADEIAILEATLVELRAAHAAAVAKFGSVEAVTIEHDAIMKAWHDVLFAESSAISKSGVRYRGHILDVARDAIVARGTTLAQPHIAGTLYDVLDTANKIRYAEGSIATLSRIKVGAQGVYSWHASVALANKALNASQLAKYVRGVGHRTDVRTDITVVEKTVTPRAKKA